MPTVRTLIGNIKGPKGDTGSQGPQGEQGPGATVNVGTVSTTAYGNPVQITNSGTETDAVLDFVIPQGKPGEQTTKMSLLTLDTITTQTAEYPIPAVGDVGSTAWGKIVKFFNDIKTAVTGKVDTTSIVNNLTSTSTDKPLSAAQGKALNDALSSKVGNNQGGANPVTFIQQVNNGDLRVYGTLNTWKTFQSDDHVLRCALYSFGSQTVAANTHTNLQLAKSIGGNIVAAFVTGTPNAAYVFANVNTISNSGVNIGVYNTASSAVTGTFTIAVLYTNA